MAIFCTQCGTSNASDNAYCDDCGAVLKKPRVTHLIEPAFPHDLGATSPKAAKNIIIVLGSVLGVLVFAGVALYLALASPEPTSARLLAAIVATDGEKLTDRSQRELCFSNMDYSSPTLSVASYDQHTQFWLNTLVSAGLYKSDQQVVQGGVLGQNFIQYVAMPELAKWHDGKRLCLSRNVVVTDIVDIGPSKEENLRGVDGLSKIQTVSANAVLNAQDVAPWLATEGVQKPVLQQIDGWEYRSGQLVKKIPVAFGLHDNEWVTSLTLLQIVEKQRLTHLQQGNSSISRPGPNPEKGGFFDSLHRLFSFGGHPLVGSWRVDGTAMSGLFGGVQLPDSMSPKIQFTSNTMEMGGRKTNCRFDVDGKSVTVTPEGEQVSLTFKMIDKDTAVLDMDVIKVTYKRVQ